MSDHRAFFIRSALRHRLGSQALRRSRAHRTCSRRTGDLQGHAFRGHRARLWTSRRGYGAGAVLRFRRGRRVCGAPFRAARGRKRLCHGAATCSDGSAWRAGSRCCWPCAARAGYRSLHMVKADSEGSTLDRVERPFTCGGLGFSMQTIHSKEKPPGPAGRWFIDPLKQA